MGHVEFDPVTLQRVRELILGNFAARDELNASAEVLNDSDLAEICRRLADGLGGNAADLQQLLLNAGQEPEQLRKEDEISRRLQQIVIEMLDEQQGRAAVLDEAESAEERLKQAYDEAIERTPNTEVEGLLRRQREDVEFGETVLKKVRDADAD